MNNEAEAVTAEDFRGSAFLVEEHIRREWHTCGSFFMAASISNWSSKIIDVMPEQTCSVSGACLVTVL